MTNNSNAITKLNSDKFDKSGGKLTGSLAIGDFLSLWSDSEGGNIRIIPPSNNYVSYWDVDALNGGLRVFAVKNATHPGGEGYMFPLAIDASDGSIDTPYVISAANFMDITRQIIISEWLPNGASNNGMCTNALLVEKKNQWSSTHKPMRVNSEYTTNMPANCLRGIREVLYYDQNNIIVTIKGWNISNTAGIWINTYLNGSWCGWKYCNVA